MTEFKPLPIFFPLNHTLERPFTAVDTTIAAADDITLIYVLSGLILDSRPLPDTLLLHNEVLPRCKGILNTIGADEVQAPVDNVVAVEPLVILAVEAAKKYLPHTNLLTP